MAQLQVRDAQGRGIPNIRLRFSVGTEPSDKAIYDNITDSAGNTGWPVPYWPITTYTIWANTPPSDVDTRYTSDSIVVNDGQDHQIVLASTTLPIVWPPAPRASLPPWPTPTSSQPGNPQAGCWTHDTVDPTLQFTPPSQPDIDFHRGNVMGLRCTDLPAVPGNSPDPSLVVTWFEYLYAQQGARDRMLDAYAAAGYTHLDLHRATWMGRLDKVPGCSRQEALASVEAVAKRGLFPIVNLAIDDGPPDQGELKSWINDLVSAGMKIGCLAWQIDKRIPVPVELIDYIAWAGPYLHSKGVKVATHWQLSGCAVYDGATEAKYGVHDRFSFQTWCADKVDYVYMQQNTEAPLLDTRPGEGGLIGEMSDTLISMAGNMKLIAAEYDMQAEFDDPFNRLEAYGDQKGRLLLTTTRNGRTISGYLNGGRQSNGGAL